MKISLITVAVLAFAGVILMETVMRESGVVPEEYLPLTALGEAALIIQSGIYCFGAMVGVVSNSVWYVAAWCGENLFHSLKVTLTKFVEKLAPAFDFTAFFDGLYDQLTFIREYVESKFNWSALDIKGASISIAMVIAVCIAISGIACFYNPSSPKPSKPRKSK